MIFKYVKAVQLNELSEFDNLYDIILNGQMDSNTANFVRFIIANIIYSCRYVHDNIIVMFFLLNFSCTRQDNFEK